MFYPMNTTIMFAAASLILVAAIVTVAMSHAAYAAPTKHVIEYCIKLKTGFGSCQPTLAECQALAGKFEKCFKRNN